MRSQLLTLYRLRHSKNTLCNSQFATCHNDLQNSKMMDGSKNRYSVLQTWGPKLNHQQKSWNVLQSQQHLTKITCTQGPHKVPNIILLMISFPPEKRLGQRHQRRGEGSYVFGTHSHGHQKNFIMTILSKYINVYQRHPWILCDGRDMIYGTMPPDMVIEPSTHICLLGQ